MKHGPSSWKLTLTGFDNAAALDLTAKLLNCGYEVQILKKGLSGGHQLAGEGVLAVFVCANGCIASLSKSTLELLKSPYRPLMIGMNISSEADSTAQMLHAGFDVVLPLDVPAWELDLRIQNFVERELAKASLRSELRIVSKDSRRRPVGMSRGSLAPSATLGSSYW